MKTKFTLTLLVLLLAGCQSEVDKCVSALMKDSPGAQEGLVRIACLKAQSGK